jgi:hypothetical protein
MSPKPIRINAPLAEFKQRVYIHWLEHDARVMTQRQRDLGLCLTEGGQMGRYTYNEIRVVATSLHRAEQFVSAGQ